MGVDAELQDEIGRTIDRVGDFDDAFSNALPSPESEYVWLSTIDRWGDTTFNRLQVDRLLPELDQRAEEVRAPVASRFKDVKRLASRVREEPGRYLKFLGD